MATQKLTYDDVELIFKAFEALESQDSRDALLEAMVGGGFANSREEAQENVRRVKQEYDEKKRSRRLQEEQIILLKAKLLKMRDQVEVEDLIEDELGS